MKTQQIKQELVFGVHPILELIKANKRKIFTIYTTKPEPKAFFDIKKNLKPGVQIQYVARQQLDRIAGSDDHQSVVAVVSAFVYKKDFFTPAKDKLLLFLDGIQDVRNLGGIIRTAYCSGVDGIIIPSKKSAPLSGATFKASAGLAEYVDIYLAKSPEEAAKLLKDNGYKIYLTTFDGKEASGIKYETPLCLVIGSEAEGISKSLLDKGTKITLAQVKSNLSYNASVAAGIFLYLISGQIGKID